MALPEPEHAAPDLHDVLAEMRAATLDAAAEAEARRLAVAAAAVHGVVPRLAAHVRPGQRGESIFAGALVAAMAGIVVTAVAAALGVDLAARIGAAGLIATAAGTTIAVATHRRWRRASLVVASAAYGGLAVRHGRGLAEATAAAMLADRPGSFYVDQITSVFELATQLADHTSPAVATDALRFYTKADKWLCVRLQYLAWGVNNVAEEAGPEVACAFVRTAIAGEVLDETEISALAAAVVGRYRRAPAATE